MKTTTFAATNKGIRAANPHRTGASTVLPDTE